MNLSKTWSTVSSRRWVKAFTVGLAATASMAASAPAKQPVTVPLFPYLGTLYQVYVDVGGTRVPMLLDTAGGVTVLDSATSAKSGCVPLGRVSGHRMRGQRVDLNRCDRPALSLAGISLRPATSGIFDLRSLLPANAPEIGGSLALDAFDGPITLDLGGQKLIIETPASLEERVRDAVEVKASFSREMQGLAIVPFVGVHVENGLVWFELDSGSDAEGLVAQHASKFFGLLPGNGPQTVTVSIGPKLKLKARVSVQDLIIDGNLGSPALEQYLVTIDARAGRIWMREREASKNQ